MKLLRILPLGRATVVRFNKVSLMLTTANVRVATPSLPVCYIVATPTVYSTTPTADDFLQLWRKQ